MKYSFTPSKEDFLFIKDNRDKILLSYAIQEAEIQDYCNANPLNSDIEVVKHKITLLNKYYSTRVPVDEMANHILMMPNFDTMLQKGDTDLVGLLANTDKDYFSFATKYCAMHNPDKYPIFDSYIRIIFQWLFENGFFDNTSVKRQEIFQFNQWKKDRSAHYADYIKIYDTFLKKSKIDAFGGNYRQVDYILWGSVEMRKVINKRTNNTISRIFPDIVAGLSANIIFELIKLIFDKL